MSIIALIAAATAVVPVESATLPLPPELRATASIVSIDKTGKPTALRQGVGRMVCFADQRRGDNFDARCYDRDFIPYVYRSRQLAAQGVPGKEIDTRIDQEIKAGTFHMKMTPTAGYRMSGPISALTHNGTAWTTEMFRWQSIHIPRATAQQLGLPTTNRPPMPFVMASGTLWSHVMINSPPEH